MKVSIDLIDPNPHRNFKRNPINKKQVEKLVDSIERTTFWDNVVLRKHPESKGRYQLAYGHNRLVAIGGLVDARPANVVYLSGYGTIDVPVRDLSDWDMYCAMVDENETQQEITPAIAFENVETGVEILEQYLTECHTNQAFNKKVGTIGPTYSEQAYQQVRQNFLDGKGIGRKFVSDTLPGAKMRDATIREVLGSHYGKTREQAARKKAQAKRTAAKAAKEAEEARQLEEEATALEAEAERIAGKTIRSDILLAFDTPNQMTDFAACVRRLGIKPAQHEGAMKWVRDGEYYGKQMFPKLNVWWYQQSGKAAKDQAEAKRSEFKKRHRDVSIDEEAQKLRAAMDEVERRVNAIAPYLAFIEREKTRSSLLDRADSLRAALKGLLDAPLSVEKQIEPSPIKLIEGGKQ